MVIITKEKLKQVSGGLEPIALGPIGEAVAIGATIYEVPGIINGTTTQEWGQQVGPYLGQYIYDVTHPNPLGQTIYYPEDHGWSYITPMPFF